MKVALLHPSFSPMGETEQQALEAAALLQTSGVETLYITQSTQDGPVPCHEFPDLFAYHPFQKGRVRADLTRLEILLRQENVDLVHLMGTHEPLVTEFLSARWPTVRTIHNLSLV